MIKLPLFAIAAFAIVLGSPAGAQPWTAIDVGWAHACVLDAEGRAYCWGTNHVGQLGAATPDRCQPLAGSTQPFCTPSDSQVPVAVSGGHRFRHIRAGSSATCGVDLQDRLLCWGILIGHTPTTPPFAGGLRFGPLHEGDQVMCGARKPSGGRCWQQRAPTWILGQEFPGLPFQVVAAAPTPGELVCGIAPDAHLMCSGKNPLGEMGTLSPSDTTGFVRSGGGRQYRAIALMANWSCGVTTEGAAYCWGALGRAGPFRGGDERCASGLPCSATPQAVEPGRRFQSLEHDGTQVCGLAEAGTIHCWKQSGEPAPTVTNERFRAISGGPRGWCGISRANAILCWEPGPAEMRPVRVPAPSASARGARPGRPRR
jgi:hypothetical protein